ncbi:hypothetical protein FSARC_10967 [Fusarium sarcochroum]|uniref:Asl1-like glycosyl hydrolase catalytic domain-containing protein n=1 Tax=Fusarium sarcochroum TaxID=1208366 RepID=A0A8H4X1G5_9HYPO|nr:hypothetical protein FSARC_10967 [Fusarium sarcochroum]
MRRSIFYHADDSPTKRITDHDEALATSLALQPPTWAASASATDTIAHVTKNKKAGKGSEVSNKRALAYNDVGLGNPFRNFCPGCSSAYNWASSSENLSTGLSFVPMLWSDWTDFTDYWDINVAKAISNGCKATLSFNEPDKEDQANMTPGEAAMSHVHHLNPYSGNVMVGVPSVSNSIEGGQGLFWLAAFFRACSQQGQNCAVDFCPVHWYSWDVKYREQWSADLLLHLEKAYKVCGRRPIWLTAFAVTGSEKIFQSFVQETVPELEELGYLDAYLYFKVAVGSLMSSERFLSSYGQVHASLDQASTAT